MNQRRLNYLNIGNQLEMREQLFVERYNIWDELFPLPKRRGKGARTMDGEADYEFDIDAEH